MVSNHRLQQPDVLMDIIFGIHFQVVTSKHRGLFYFYLNPLTADMYIVQHHQFAKPSSYFRSTACDTYAKQQAPPYGQVSYLNSERSFVCRVQNTHTHTNRREMGYNYRKFPLIKATSTLLLTRFVVDVWLNKTLRCG